MNLFKSIPNSFTRTKSSKLALESSMLLFLLQHRLRIQRFLNLTRQYSICLQNPWKRRRKRRKRWKTTKRRKNPLSMKLNQKKRTKMSRFQSPKTTKKMAFPKRRRKMSSKKKRKSQVQLGPKEHLRRWKMRTKMLVRKKSPFLKWKTKALNSEIKRNISYI